MFLKNKFPEEANYVPRVNKRICVIQFLFLTTLQVRDVTEYTSLNSMGSTPIILKIREHSFGMIFSLPLSAVLFYIEKIISV